MQRFFRNKNFTVGLILSTMVVAVAAVSLAWTPYDGNKMNARERLQAPSWAHPLGTDQYGRDSLSRVMTGAVNSIIVGLVTVAIGLTIGVALGLASAYYGKLLDEAIMRFSDLLFGFPAVLTAILITSILGPSMVNAMLDPGRRRSGMGEGVHRRRPCERHQRVVDHLAPCRAEHPLAAHHSGHHPVCGGDPGRSRVELSGPGNPTAHGLMGPDVERRPDLHVHLALDGDIPGGGDRLGGARFQFAG
jgi:hypothetical protein